MVKYLKEAFSEEEFESLKVAKGKKTWREFILGCSRVVPREAVE